MLRHLKVLRIAIPTVGYAYAIRQQSYSISPNTFQTFSQIHPSVLSRGFLLSLRLFTRTITDTDDEKIIKNSKRAVKILCVSCATQFNLKQRNFEPAN